MVKNKTIQIRVTRDQHDRILSNAKAKGFITISAYLRDLALNGDSRIEEKINEIYRKVVVED